MRKGIEYSTSEIETWKVLKIRRIPVQSAQSLVEYICDEGKTIASSFRAVVVGFSAVFRNDTIRILERNGSEPGEKATAESRPKITWISHMRNMYVRRPGKRRSLRYLEFWKVANAKNGESLLEMLGTMCMRMSGGGVGIKDKEEE